MPVGLLLTIPVPEPDLETVNVFVFTVVLKTAVTKAVPFTTQVPAPEQPPPLQPTNTDPLDAAAFKVVAEPASKREEQVVPQLMPPGEDVTVPLPAPCLTTVTV
jgi:hypothetical protein